MNSPTLAILAIRKGSVDSHGPGSLWLDLLGYVRSILLSQANLLVHSGLGSLIMERVGSNDSLGIVAGSLYSTRSAILMVELMPKSGGKSNT